MAFYYTTNSDYLAHHGIKGQKWGIRRYQNKNGSLTNAGSKRYDEETSKKTVNSSSKGNSHGITSSSETQRKSRLSDKQKKAIKVGVAVAGTALAAYGTYKLAKYAQNARTKRASAKAAKYITDHYLEQFGETKIKDGTTVRSFGYYRSSKGKGIYQKTIKGMSDKELKERNEYVTAKGMKILKDATNTRFDKGIAKVVNAGNAVGRRTRKVGKAINNASRKVARG